MPSRKASPAAFTQSSVQGLFDRDCVKTVIAPAATTPDPTRANPAGVVAAGVDALRTAASA